MKKIVLKKLIYFYNKEEIIFWEWFPVGKENSITFEYNDIHYYLYITLDDKCFDFLPDIKKLNKSKAWVKALVLEINFNANDEVYNSILEMKPPEDLINELGTYLLLIEKSFKDIVRNDLVQFWIDHNMKYLQAE